MSAVASSSAVTSSNQSLLKRHHDSSSDAEICIKQRYFYVLAPETTDYSSDGPESIYSVQAKSTDLAHDTSDTCTKDSWATSDDDSRMIELEVVSFSESEREFPFPVTTSSSPEDMDKMDVAGISQTSDRGRGVGCSSRRSAEGSDDEIDGKVRTVGPFTFCIHCKGINSDPHFMYCIRCHRARKSFLPERPKGRRGKSRRLTSSANSETPDSGLNSQSSGEALLMFDCPPHSSDSALVSELCHICMTRPRDGGFCHDNIIHVYSCYRCSLKTYKQRGRCPVCNRKPKHVSKIILA